MAKTRTEEDALGKVEVPAEHLWGAQTQRSIDNFPIGRGRFRLGRRAIRAFGIVKKCAALANRALGQLPAEKADLIARAADEVIAGRWDDEFPLVAFQTGASLTGVTDAVNRPYSALKLEPPPLTAVLANWPALPVVWSQPAKTRLNEPFSLAAGT